MKKHVIRALIAGTAVGTALMLGAGTALAATTTTTLTVTVSGANSNGSVTASAGTTTLKDTRNGNTLTCTSSTGTGTAKDEKITGTAPVKGGTINNTVFNHCTGPGGLTFTVKQNTVYNLVATKATSGGVTAGGVTNVKATLTGTACTATVTGKAPGTYKNPTSTTKPVLTFSPTAPNPFGFKLTVVSANCMGLIKVGDVTTYSGTYTITSPTTLKVNVTG
jgi:hypothetical protein